MCIDFTSITRSIVKLIESCHTKIKGSVYVYNNNNRTSRCSNEKLSYFKAIMWEAANNITLTLYILVFSEEPQQSNQIKLGRMY